MSSALRVELRHLRKILVSIDGKPTPSSISLLKSLLAETVDVSEHNKLLSILAEEYARVGCKEEHLATSREIFANAPEDVDSWLSLAHSLSVLGEDEEAKQTVIRGVEIARQKGEVLRSALWYQSFVARRALDTQLFEQALRELIANASKLLNTDRELESNWLDEVPDGFCSEELAEEYRALFRNE